MSNKVAPKPVDPALPVIAPRKSRSPGIVTVFLEYVGDLSILLGQSVSFIARGQIDLRNLIEQMAAIGVNSVPIALLTSMASGAVIALYFVPFLKQYGQDGLSGGFVALAVSRELAPVLTGVVVAARAGSAIAAEIGTMKVTEQVAALRSLAVSPVQYLVVPRLVAAVLMLPMVGAVADAMGIFGGYLVSRAFGVSPSTFPESIHEILEPRDFSMGLLKTVAFGLILALIGCSQGLRTEGGATEVGKATTHSVVISIALIYVSNYFMAYFMFPRVTAV